MGWTDERVELLKKLWQEGLSASQIAKALGGVTRNSVIGKVHRLGLSGRAPASKPTAIQRRPARRSMVDMERVRSIVAPPKIVTRAPPMFEEPGDALSLQPIPFEDRGRHHCLWPIGDPKSPAYDCCGRPVGLRKNGSRRSYCDDHQGASQPALAFGRTDVKKLASWVDSVEARRPRYIGGPQAS
jgi:GcrA cell cycle regulator